MRRLWFMLSVVLLTACLCCRQAQAAKLEEVFSAAQKAYAEKRYDEAVEGFVSAADMLVKARQGPKARLVLGNAAVIRIAQERYADAATLYEQALALPGSDPVFSAKAWRNLAVCHSHLGQYGLTVNYLEKLLPKTDKLPAAEKEAASELYAQLGDAYRALEIYTKAADCYERANSFLPAEAKPETRCKILTALGLCQGNLGRFAQARGNLEAARQIASLLGQPLTVAEAVSNLGILSWERGDYSEASKLLDKALAVEKDASLTRNEGVDTNNMGLVFKSVGRHGEAAARFKTAIELARKAGNPKDEAIALSNLALVCRIQGNLAAAREHYAAALALYESCGFREGRASTLLGLGKIRETADRDFAGALTAYQEAYDIYATLAMPRGKAEALNQMGRVLCKAAAPHRATRDLVFDDEEITFPPIDAATATDNARKAYQEALEITEPLGIRELVWSARQGLGFLLWQEGNLKDALTEYQEAIKLVTSMRSSQADVELLGDYMKDKSDLFTEAMEICIALHKATGEQQYMAQALEYDETLRNEISKAGMTLVQMDYLDPAKQDIYRKLVDLNTQRNKAASAIPAMEKPDDKVSSEQQKTAVLRAEEAKRARSEVISLEKTYNELLAEWRKKYPEDAVMFDSSAKIDTKAIQTGLTDDDAVLYYIALPDNLIITVITKEGTNLYAVDVPEKELNHMVRDEFLYQGIEVGARNMKGAEEEQRQMTACVQLMRRFYGLLMEPVEQVIHDKKNLTIISSGYLAQLPFPALVSDDSNPMSPVFLVESKNITLSRLSFYQPDREKRNHTPPTSILAVGNPRNSRFKMAKLKGAETEIRSAISNLRLTEQAVLESYNKDSTETLWKHSFMQDQHDMVYFATHGMPFSDTYTSYEIAFKKLPPEEQAKGKSSKVYLEEKLPGISHFNSFLYMAESDNDDGFLTIKEIMELPADAFRSTRYVILSACNTGVTFAPKALAGLDIENVLSAPEVEQELRQAGWIPGVDQISFVDTFMKRDVGYTYGTLWFVDDKSSSLIMNSFTTKMIEEDITLSYTYAMRDYIKTCKSGSNPLGDTYITVPLHPYFWAVGTIFSH